MVSDKGCRGPRGLLSRRAWLRTLSHRDLICINVELNPSWSWGMSQRLFRWGLHHHDDKALKVVEMNDRGKWETGKRRAPAWDTALDAKAINQPLTSLSNRESRATCQEICTCAADVKAEFFILLPLLFAINFGAKLRKKSEIKRKRKKSSKIDCRI